MIVCPNKRSKSWKNLVTARGETTAYNLWYLYDGEVPENEYVTPQEITPNDKIIWGHPGIGKTFLRQTNQDIIDFDSDYKNRINEKYNLPEGFEARNKWRESNPELWKEEIRQLWSEATQESQATGKQLLASDMMLLREFPNDFDKVVNISNETFINRAKQRDDYTEGETEQWKANINEVLGSVPQSKIIQTDKYISELLSEKPIPTISYKPIKKDLFEYNQDFEKISKVLSNLDVNKTLLDFITPSTIESTLQNAGFSDEMVTQLTDFYNSNRDLMYSAPNIYEVANAYVSSKIPFGRTEIVKNADKELESKLLKWLEPLNISVKDLNDFKKNLNVNALGIADIINKTIYLAKERQIDTLPEEVAHFYVEFLEKRNKKGQSKNYLLYDDLINKIESWSEYQKYYDEYSNIYVKDGVVNIEKVKKEIIGKAISEAVVRRFETKDLGLYSLIQEVIDYLRSIFKNRPLLNIQSLADDIAEKILSENYSDIKKDLSEDVKLRDYKSVPKEVRDIIHNISSAGATMTGSVALRKAGTVYREDGEEFHDLDFKVSSTINRESFLNKIKKIYPSLNLKSEFQSGSSYTTLWNITVDGKIYDIDFFFETKPYNKLDNFVHWADTFAAKLDLGRAKDVTDFINYKPYKKFSLFPKKDVVIDDYLYYQTESLPKFKPKPANTLNSLEIEQFRVALDTSLQVGGTINFNYWSEGTSGEISNKDVEVLSVDDNTFVGRYPTGDERVFRFDNVVSKAIPGKYEVHEQAIFKSNLAIGKTVTVSSNGLEYSGTVAEIGGDNFTVLDPDGTIYNLKYAEIDKENYERRIFQRASEMKNVLEEQIKRFSKNAKSQFQIDRIALLQQAVAHLDTYKGTVDLIKFMKLLQESVNKSKALMRNLSESDKDLDSMTENEKIEEVNKRLSKLSFLKDYVDSMMVFKKMAYEIAESDSSQELKDKAGGLSLEIDSADNMYYEVAIPNIADWLWMCFPKKLNSQLLLIGEEEWTKERLIQELRQPTKDLDFLNSYGVPVANANDIITGLFSKAVKKVLQYAKINHINLEKNLLPFFKKVQATGAKMEEVYKKFYTIKQMETEEEVIVDGQPTIQKVTKNVRVFIEKYDLQLYYDTVRGFTSQIKSLNDKIAVTDNTAERNALFTEKKKISAALTAYQKKTAINYSFTQMNEMMEKLRKNNVPTFLENLNKFYKAGEETPTSFKYTTEDGAVVYYNYRGNFYKPNKEAIDPDTGKKIFLTEDYENLMKESQEVIDLYNEVKRIYDEKNNMLPEHLKLKGVVPVFYEQSMLKDLSKTISNRGKYNDAQELRKKDKKTFTKLNGEPYQNIPVGYTKILDVSESSDNIMQSFLLWANDVQMFKAKNDVIGSVENLTTVLEKNKPIGENGEGKSKINRRVEVIKKYANQVLYGETRASNEWWDRVFDYMGKFTALTRMLIKPSSALNNLIIGNYALLSEAIGGRNFTTKELWKAHKKYVDLVANDKEKLNNMLITLDAIQGRFKDEIGNDFQTLQDTFGFNTAFSLNNTAEHQIQAVSMLALLEKWGVEVPENGMFEVDKLPDNFLGTLHELNKANNGVYSESDRLYHQDESLFRLFLQFRKYIVPTFRTKWSGMTQKGNNKYRMDLEAGSIELGYYRAFGEFVWNNVVKIKNLPNLIANYKNLNEVEKEGVMRGLVDGVAFASIGLLFLPLAGADDDDWDDDEHSRFENLIHWELIYQLARLRADIGTYIPGFGFSDQSRLVNQPFAAASTATQLAKIVGIVFDFEEDDEGNISIWKQYDRDYGRFKKGDLKILQPISKLNPLDNPYEDLFPHVQYNDFKGASR